MFTFTYLWPYMGLGAALLLGLLLATDILRSDRTASRWQDLAWLAWAGVFAYLVHQFEEHGIGFFGTTYAFRNKLCADVGFADMQTCPVPFSFITSVNVSLVWLAGPTSALLGRRWPIVALSFFNVPFVNLFAHLIPALARGHYNPGLVTALMVFLPLSLWTFHVALARYGLGWRAIITTIAAGIVLHAVLIGSLMAYLEGRIGVVALDVTQILNPFIGMLIVVRLGRQPRKKTTR